LEGEHKFEGILNFCSWSGWRRLWDKIMIN